MAVILSPFAVILSEAKDLLLAALRVNSAKDLLFSWAGKSRFFDPTKTVGTQNDTIGGRMAVYSNFENGID